MGNLPIDLTLYGIALAPFVLAITMLAQQLGLSDYWADWLRAGLTTLFAALVLNQAALAAVLPWFPGVATQVLTLLSILLLMKGVWPDLRSGWNRLVRGQAMEPMAARGGRRGRLW